MKEVTKNEKQPKRKLGLPKIQLVQEHLLSLNDFRFNVVTGNTEIISKTGSEAKIMTDFDLNSMTRSLALANIDYPAGLVRNLLKSDFIQKYNPFENYFNNLPRWDGTTDHIRRLAETVDTDDPGLWLKSFRKWLVALVAGALDDQVINHTMIVLTGNQGLGKTTWILGLLPEQLKDYVFSGTINPDNKDTLIYLAESMLINLDELENLNKHQLGSIKELVTKNQVRIRRPYGTIFETLPRRASFAGSVNNREFLSDTSGSRRFLCFEVFKIRYHNEIDLDMVYAQALELFRNGFRFWFNGDEIDQINQNNEKFRIKSIEEEQLFRYFAKCEKTDATDFLKTSEILEVVFFNHRNLINNGSSQLLGKILTANGFVKTKRNGRVGYYLKRMGLNFEGYPAETLTDIGL
jgi:predicted P-loop ATPase